MILIYNKFKLLLSPSQKKGIYLVWFLMFLSSIVQAFGVFSIIPFIAVVGNPEIIRNNEYLFKVFSFFNFESDLSFLIFLGAAFLIFIIFSNLIKGLSQWMQMRFIRDVSTDMQTQLFQSYLNKPYSFYLTRNTSNMSKTLLGETNQVTTGVLIPYLEMVSQGLISITLVLLLFITDPIIAIVSVLVLGGLYGVIFYMIKKKLNFYGIERVKLQGRRFKSATEGLNGIKEIKIFGRESTFLNSFRAAADGVLKISERARLFQLMPPIFMEIITFGGLLTIVLYLLLTLGSIGNALPFLTLYAMAGYKLKPALQHYFSNSATIRFNIPALESVLEDYSLSIKEKNQIIESRKENRISLKKCIEIKNISFSYPNTKELFTDLSLKLPARKSYAFVGSTGSGKSTLVDIIIGLLHPQKGGLFVDDIHINDHNIRDWQNNIGYIPQHIYLADTSLRENIAFGIKPADIDDNRIKEVAEIANLHDYISELPKGYKTVVGERGVRLSGGQRQRIGIARALYHDPDVLVMDEATSALDNTTEAAVMNAIDRLSGEITIIMIAHRLTTVRKCDEIFLLSNGKIQASGTYEELFHKNATFKEMVES
ncbi:ABC transporter ATP-binding protein [soil metagenome]